MSTATKSYAERYVEQVRVKNALAASIAAELDEAQRARRADGVRPLSSEAVVRFVLTRIYP